MRMSRREAEYRQRCWLAVGLVWLLMWGSGRADSATTVIAERIQPAMQAVAQRTGERGLLVLTLVAEGSLGESWGIPGLVYDESVRLLQEAPARVLVSSRIVAMIDAGQIKAPLAGSALSRVRELAIFDFLLVETYNHSKAGRTVGLVLFDSAGHTVWSGRVLLHESDVEPPSNLPPLNRKVLAYCADRFGQQVGDGECWTLAALACAEVEAHRTGVRGFGRRLGLWDTPIPGDIVQMDQAVFARNGVSRTVRKHTAVVESVQSPGVVGVLQQNVGPAGKKVSRGTLRLNEKIGGALDVYRPRRKVHKACEPAPAGLLQEAPAAVEVPLQGDAKLVLRPIPAGRFLMGTAERVSIKLIPVTLTRPFHMGVTEVTQAQWTAVMGANPSEVQGDDLPVTNVSWNDVQKFLTTLNGSPPGQRFHFRLPTDAEWEYACRAGAAGRYSFGEDDLDMPERAWFADTSAGRAHPVGRLWPNRWGLYDMHGNVWELIQDLYSVLPNEDPPVPQTDPLGPAGGNTHVIRGGTFDSSAGACSCGNRRKITPAGKSRFTGFRLVAMPK